MSGGDTGWIKYKSRQVMQYTLANTRHLTKPCAHLQGRPLAGQPAFIVGAGPSLTPALKHLRNYKKYGAVFAVNASLRALENNGIVPDVVVARESLRIADQLEGTKAPMIALDIGAHPDCFELPNAAWWIPGYPRHFHLACFLLGIRPTFGGTAALTAAVALALEWGATEIVLVGVDLCMRRGRGYADGTPRGDMRVKVEDEGRTLRLSNDDYALDQLKRSGQSGLGEVLRGVFVVDQEGNEVPTQDPWVSQLEWLAEHALRHPDRKFTNCSVGGANIPGWDNERLYGWVGRGKRERFDWKPEPWLIDPEVAKGAREALDYEGRLMKQAAGEIANGVDFDTLAVMDLFEDAFPHFDTLTAQDLLHIGFNYPTAKARRERVCRIYQEAADIGLEALGE